MIVPGAGEPNPDSYNYNPYQTKKQRGMTEKNMLLEKCPPETIALDPTLLAKLDDKKVEGTTGILIFTCITYNNKTMTKRNFYSHAKQYCEL